MATESQQSPTQGSPMSCSHAHSPHSPPPHSPTQTGLNPVQVQPGPTEPQQSPPPHSPVQDNTTQTQLDRPCSPTKIIITQPQHSPPKTRHSPSPHSPAQVGTSHPQSPTQDAEPTLDQESPGSSSPAQLRCGPTHDISTLDEDLSLVYFRSTQTTRRRASPRPISAPCSPSPAPLRATQCSWSQPASPVQAHSSQPVRPSQLSLLPSQLATQSRVTKYFTQTSTTELKSLEHCPMQLSPNLDGQTLESSPAPLSPASNLSTVPPDSHGTDDKLPNQLGPVQSSALSLEHSSPLHVPAMPTPESLVHISTSMEHSSLTCSPCADETEEIPPPASHVHQSPSCDSPSRCTEAIEGKASPIHIQNSSPSASPKHASQMPTSPAISIQACASPMQVETSPAHVSPTAAENGPPTQPASPVTLPGSYSVQPVDPLTPPVRSPAQPASPAILAGSIPPITPCQDEEKAVAADHPNQSETCPSHPNSTPDSPVHNSPIYASPVHTEAISGYSRMGSMPNPQETTNPSVCSFAKVAQTQTSRSPTHSGQSSPSYVQTTYSPSQTSPETSPLPAPSSFSPSHCRLTHTGPASISVGHSLSHSGQTSSRSAGITDVGIIHSPPRSSPAGQASPVHIQSTSSCAHSGPVQRQTPSLASTTYSSPAHATVACVSPPHSPTQASETYRSPTGSPHYSPAPNTGTGSGLTLAQLSPTLTSSSPDVDMVASSIIQSSVLPSVVQLDSGLVKPTDSIRQASPTPASSLPDDSSADSPNQASLSQVSQSPASPFHTPDSSAVENQQSAASRSPLYQRPATPVDATSSQASPSHASPVHSSSTQDNTAMPSTSHTSETPASLPHSAPPQVSPLQTFSHGPQAQAGSVHSSPVISPVCGSLQSGDTQANPSPVPASPVWPEGSPSPENPVQPEASQRLGPDSPMRCEASPGPNYVSPVLATPGQFESSSHSGPTSPEQPAAGSGSPQEHTRTERGSAATVGEYQGDWLT